MAGTVPTSNTVSIAATPAAQQGQATSDILNLVLSELKAIRRTLGSADGAAAGLLAGSESFTIPSMANTAGTGVSSTGATVTGAAVGDLVIVGITPTPGGLTFCGYVSGANTVKTAFSNTSGGTLNIGAATIRYIVIPQAALSLPAMVLTA